jgi:hypothetical protein
MSRGREQILVFSRSSLRLARCVTRRDGPAWATASRTLTFAAIVCLIGCAKPAVAPGRKYEPPDERYVFFVIGKADVLPDGYFSIGYVTALLDADPALSVLIVGHADPHGRADANRDLSLRRARTVRKVLVEHGVKEGRVAVAAPREQSESSVADAARRADLFVYDPGHEPPEHRVGYPIELKAEGP